jgi:hypothetical protein
MTATTTIDAAAQGAALLDRIRPGRVAKIQRPLDTAFPGTCDLVLGQVYGRYGSAVDELFCVADDYDHLRVWWEREIAARTAAARDDTDHL